MLPQSVKAVLWSYDTSKIDLQKHRRLIVSQVLNFGTKKATDWLFKFYGKDIVRATAIEIPLGQWDKKSLALWSQYINFTVKSRSEKILAK